MRTPLDTWSRPIWDLLVFYLLRQFYSWACRYNCIFLDYAIRTSFGTFSIRPLSYRFILIIRFTCASSLCYRVFTTYLRYFIICNFLKIQSGHMTKTVDQQRIQKQGDNTTTPQKLSFTEIADGLRTDIIRNESHPTSVVKPVYRIQTFPLTAKALL